MRFGVVALGLFVFTLALPGCLTADGPTPESNDSNQDRAHADAADEANPGGDLPSTGVASISIDLVDCAFFPAAFTAPRATVEGLVPPEYEPRGPAPDIVQVNLHLLKCAHYTAGNLTIGQDLTYAAALIRVDPPQEAANGTDLHFFNLETYASDAPLVALLAARGLPITNGTVTWNGDDTTFEALVEADGTAVYTLTGGYGIGEASAQQKVQRNHFLGSDGQARWLDFNEAVQLPSWPLPATMVTDGGALAGIWTEAAPAAGGLLSEGTMSATITFNELRG